MSSTIIYHQVALWFPKESIGRSEDFFAIVAQAGASNCFEQGNGPGGCGRRSRDWMAFAFGTIDHVMAEAIRFAGAFEGGMVKMRHMRGDISPEQYIRSARGLLKRAMEHNIMRGPVQFKEGHIHCHLTVPAPENGGARPSSVSLYAENELKAWLSTDAFGKLHESMRASALLHVSGPAIRA